MMRTLGRRASRGERSAKLPGTLGAGDTVYVRGGVYAEQVILSKSGTQDNPIRFLAYPGETPVIEGSGLSIAYRDLPCCELAGNWIVVSGFEVRNSKYIGIELSGQHNVVDNVFSHHSKETGILVRGDYSTVQNSRIWRSALNNEYGAKSGGGWASGLSAARDNVDGKTDYAVLRNNISWENWGEGVSSFEANGTLIEGNIAYDNYSTNIYISDTTNALCQGNMVYMTPGSYLNGYGAHVGIMMGDEVYEPPSANNTVINNIAYGNKAEFLLVARETRVGAGQRTDCQQHLCQQHDGGRGSDQPGQPSKRAFHRQHRRARWITAGSVDLVEFSIDVVPQSLVQNSQWCCNGSGRCHRGS